MTTTLKLYVDKLSESVSVIMTDYLSNNNDDSDLIKTHFSDRVTHENNTRNHFKKFQEYYFRTLNNTEIFLSPEKFFEKFRQHYSLLGISSDGIDKLEHDKSIILDLIHQDNISKLYFEHFATGEKHFGSFFTKIVHTFNPDNYCAVDNPIKEYFELNRESYFISLLVISSAFKNWANKNRPRIDSIRKELKNADKNNLLQHDKITDMKLLNLIFWSVADNEQRKGSR